jgi:hypothetical protein
MSIRASAAVAVVPSREFSVMMSRRGRVAAMCSAVAAVASVASADETSGQGLREASVSGLERGVINNYGNYMLPWVRRIWTGLPQCFEVRIEQVSVPGGLNMVVVGQRPQEVMRDRHYPDRVVIRNHYSSWVTVIVLARPGIEQVDFQIRYVGGGSPSGFPCIDPTPWEPLVFAPPSNAGEHPSTASEEGVP